jgi:hypothetical protein
MKKYALAILTCIIVLLMLSNLKTTAWQNTQNKQKELGSVVFDLPGMNEVIIRKDIPYQDIAGSTLRMDIYYPPKFDFKKQIPAIIFISGCPDTSMVKLVGNPFRKFSQYTSWCKLVAANGMAAIVYETVDPQNNLISLAKYINSDKGSLSINKNSIGAFACSGHVPTGVSYILISSNSIFKCAVLYYGYFLTSNSEYLSKIEALFQMQGFQKPPILTEPINWKIDVPFLLVRGGLDKVPFVNQSMQIFYNMAINQNLPITIINYPKGTHGFDIYTNNDSTRLVIKKTLDFWKLFLMNSNNN